MGSIPSSAMGSSSNDIIQHALNAGIRRQEIEAQIDAHLLSDFGCPPKAARTWFMTEKPPRLFPQPIGKDVLEWMKHARQAAPMSSQVMSWLVKFLEADLLPPPKSVQQLIHGVHGKVQLSSDKDRDQEFFEAVAWLKKALSDAHHSASIKARALELLSCDKFWVRMSKDESMFRGLQSFCSDELHRLGAELVTYFNNHNLSQEIGEFKLPTQAKLMHSATHLRQDHPSVGLIPINSATDGGKIMERDESVYIHALRMLALCLNESFQEKVRAAVQQHSGEHKSCSIKGDVRIRNKWHSPDDHEREPRPRPACNIDVNRCCVTFDTPQQLKRAAEALVAQFGGAAARVKNGFSMTTEEAAESFEYRSLMVNVMFEPNVTHGEMFGAEGHGQLLHSTAASTVAQYLSAPPSNPNDVCVEYDKDTGVQRKKFLWCKWRHEALAAWQHLKSQELAEIPVKIVCEVQLLLRPYLNVRQKMHLLYKFVRADSKESLRKQFADVVEADVAGSLELESKSTWESEETKCVLRTKEIIGTRDPKSALFFAAESGFTKALNVALEHVDGGDTRFINQRNGQGETALYIASFYGNFEVVDLLLRQPGIDTAVVRRDSGMLHIGTHTPLSIACQNDHVDIVRLLLTNKKGCGAENLGRVLYSAVCDNRQDIVRVLLGVEELNVNYVGEEEMTPLQIAVKRGFVDIEEMLRGHERAKVRFFQLTGGVLRSSLGVENGRRSP